MLRTTSTGPRFSKPEASAGAGGAAFWARRLAGTRPVKSAVNPSRKAQKKFRMEMDGLLRFSRNIGQAPEDSKTNRDMTLAGKGGDWRLIPLPRQGPFVDW